jgi:hypothetical protein
MDPDEQLLRRTHQGTAGDLRLDESATRIDAGRQSATERQQAFAAMAERLLEGEIPGI